MMEMEMVELHILPSTEETAQAKAKFVATLAEECLGTRQIHHRLVRRLHPAQALPDSGFATPRRRDSVGPVAHLLER